VKNKVGGANGMHGKGDTGNMYGSLAVNEVLRSSVIIAAKPEGLSQS
jgi:hypothetical protein